MLRCNDEGEWVNGKEVEEEILRWSWLNIWQWLVCDIMLRKPNKNDSSFIQLSENFAATSIEDEARRLNPLNITNHSNLNNFYSENLIFNWIDFQHKAKCVRRMLNYNEILCNSFIDCGSVEKAKKKKKQRAKRASPTVNRCFINPHDFVIAQASFELKVQWKFLNLS